MKSIKELKTICQIPDDPRDTFHIRFFCRKLSIYITKILLHTSISANQATLLFTAVALLSCVCFLFPSNHARLIGVLILQLAFVFDCVDGEIARFRQTSSTTGIYLDHIAHAIFHPLVFASLALGLFFEFRNVFLIIFGFSSSLSILLNSLVASMKYSIFFEVNASKPVLNHLNCTTKHLEQMKEIDNINNRNYLRKLIRMVFKFPGIMNILTSTIILDLMARKAILPSLKVSYVSMFIVFYGLFLPYFWIKTIYNTIKK